jgi:hypothetical protein
LSNRWELSEGATTGLVSNCVDPRVRGCLVGMVDGLLIVVDGLLIVVDGLLIVVVVGSAPVA